MNLTDHEPTVEFMQQIADQCRVVAQLAKNLAAIHDDYASVFGSGDEGPRVISNLIGARAASFMEQLGDMLNAMDAVEDADEWMEPIFREAQRLFPTSAPKEEGIGP